MEHSLLFSTSTGPFPFGSYQNYVHQLSSLQPEYGWLAAFLQRPGERSSTEVLVYDSNGTTLNITSLSGLSKTKMLSMLPNTSAKTRLIIVIYDQCWSIDRSVVEAIGEAWSIDPVFFWQTFDHYYAKNDRRCPPEMRNRDLFGTLWTFPLPSEQTSLDACYIDAGMNALFLGPSKMNCGNTVVIFLRDPMRCVAGSTRDARPLPTALMKYILVGDRKDFSQATLARRYLAILDQFTPLQIASADRHLLEYVSPYLHLLAVEVFARLQRQSFLLEQQYYEGGSARAQTEALEESWAIVHDTRLYMTNSQKSIERFAKSKSLSSNQAKEILMDYRTLMSQIRIVQGDLRDYLSRHIGMLALQDSKKTIEQAVTMNGLTKLAFIFIPLNFITSAFGMNITNLGTGKAELWMVLISFLLLGTLVLVTVLWRTKAATRVATDECETDSKTFRTVWKLVKSSPQDALWYLWFLARNSEDDGRAFTATINRDAAGEWMERDHNDYPSRQPCFEFPAFKRLSDRDLWERRARRMNQVLLSAKLSGQKVSG